MLIQPTAPQLAYIVFRRARLIIGTAAVVFALACLYCVIATPKYEASTSLVAEFSALPSGVPGSSDSSSMPMSTPMDHEEIINSYILELKSPELVRQVVEEIGAERLYPPQGGFNPLALIPDYSPPPDPQTLHEAIVQNAVDRLTKKDLKVEGQRDTNVITISVRNPSRSLAVLFARLLNDAFLELEARITHNPRTGFIQQQVLAYRHDVTAAQAAMSEFQKRYFISSMSEERTVLIQQRALLQQAMMANESRVAESHARYESLTAQMDDIAPVVTTAQNDRDPLELEARTNLSDLLAREARMRSEFGADSAAVAEIHKSIAAAELVLSQAHHAAPLTHADPNTAYQQIQIAAVQARSDWEAAQQSVKTQATQVDTLNGRLAVIDGAESTYQDLVRDYQIADQNYRVYLQGVQEARVAEDLNKAKVTSVAVFDAPYAPPKPIKPGLLVMLLGAFGGLVLGFALAFIAEALDETLSKPEHVRDVLDLPVLGSIKA
jgi:succinoglycan biosynthesis transport protein ExoP